MLGTAGSTARHRFPLPPVGLLSPSLYTILPQPPLLKEQWTQAPSTESTAEVKTRFFY